MPKDKAARRAQILEDWIELDLTRAAREASLSPAFGVDDLLTRIGDIMLAGKHPVLAGESGVGKTSLVHELVRRAAAGEGPPQFHDKRFVQISIRARASAFAKSERLRPAFQELVDALVHEGSNIVPFFRDLHQVYHFDCEPQLERLGMTFRGMILGEGDRAVLDSMFQYQQELQRFFVMVPIAEPSFERMRDLLARWSACRAEGGRNFSTAALDTARDLTHRYLSRSRMPRKAVELLHSVASTVPDDETIQPEHVISHFHDVYRVPRLLIDPAETYDPLETERLFRSRVLFQDEAVEATVRMVSAVKAGLADPRRPIGAFLFAGPTGVGKTHLAQLLAEFLFGSKDKLVRINMADYQSDGSAPVLFGVPNAAMAQARGVLTQRLSGHHFAVLLLDEFEKASEKTHDRFLQLIDEGAFINGAGETISCRSVIIIATSNAGAEVYRERAIGWSTRPDVAALDRELDRLLLQRFRPEFLNRFDQIVHFHPLPRQAIRQVALREVEAVSRRSGLVNRGLTLEVDESVLDWLAVHGYDPHFGARFLRRTIERNVTTAISEVLVTDPSLCDCPIELGVRGGRVAARPRVARPASPPAEVSIPRGGETVTRSLGRAELEAEAQRLLVLAEPLFVELDRKRTRTTEILAEMGKVDMWADPETTDARLSEYRELEVTHRFLERTCRPLARLREAFAGPPVETSELARTVERAARALAEWRERSAEAGPSRCYLLVRSVDALSPAGEWVEQLTQLLIAWCRRLHLSPELVALGVDDQVLTRTLIEVEGPGAGVYLGMEAGVHRLHRAGARDIKTRVDVIESVDRATANPSPLSTLRNLPRVHEALGLRADLALTVNLPERGQYWEFLGNDRSLLENLGPALQQHFGRPDTTPPVARVYAHGGLGASDPRTGATVPRFKDVLAGKLHPLLEAWRDARTTRAEHGDA